MRWFKSVLLCDFCAFLIFCIFFNVDQEWGENAIFEPNKRKNDVGVISKQVKKFNKTNISITSYSTSKQKSCQTDAIFPHSMFLCTHVDIVKMNTNNNFHERTNPMHLHWGMLLQTKKGIMMAPDKNEAKVSLFPNVLCGQIGDQLMWKILIFCIWCLQDPIRLFKTPYSFKSFFKL